MVIVVPVHVRKRKPRLKPATGAQFFLIAFGRAVKNLLALLEFAASSSPYDDALSTRYEVTQLLRRPLSYCGTSWLTMPGAGELKE